MICEENKEKCNDVSVRLNENWKKFRIEKWNELIHIHYKEVNKIPECNLLHDIINPPKRVKNINSHYSNILHGFMNTRHGILKFKSFQILLDSGCSPTIVTERIVEKLPPEKMLLCNGIHRPEISWIILRLKCISPYTHLERQMLWRGSVMCMTLLRVDMIWS